MVQGTSKTLKNILIGLVSTISGLILVIGVQYLDIYEKTHPASYNYFYPLMDTLARYGIVLIIGGLFIVINGRRLLSKLLKLNEEEIELDLERLDWDGSYMAKIGMYTIRKNNQELIIGRSKKKELKLIIYLSLGVITLTYLTEPMTMLVLTNLNVNNPMYQDFNLITLLLCTFVLLIFDFLILAFLYLMVRELIQDTFTVIDPLTKKIRYKSFRINPLKIFRRSLVEVTLPPENIDSLEVTMQEYKVVNPQLNGGRAQIAELPMIAVSSRNWAGDKKLFKRITSKTDNRKRIKVLSNTDSEVLDKIKTFLVEYATKGT